MFAKRLARVHLQQLIGLYGTARICLSICHEFVYFNVKRGNYLHIVMMLNVCNRE